MDLDMRVELSNRVEILNAARGLFSKRTRTLYHWMYPGASKQYIKNAVAAAWESLGNEEKDFYVSQVCNKNRKTIPILCHILYKNVIG